MAVVREWRRDTSVRLLTFLAVVTLLLSLGPYVPGFRYLIMLAGLFLLPGSVALEPGDRPGAGPARGEGIRSLGQWVGSGRSLLRLAVDFDLLGGGDTRLDRAGTSLHRQAGMAGACSGFQSGLLRLAVDRGAELSQPCLPRRASRCRIRASRQDYPDSILLRKSMHERVFADQRAWIYLRELGEAAVLMSVGCSRWPG